MYEQAFNQKSKVVFRGITIFEVKLTIKISRGSYSLLKKKTLSVSLMSQVKKWKRDRKLPCYKPIRQQQKVMAKL